MAKLLHCQCYLHALSFSVVCRSGNKDGNRNISTTYLNIYIKTEKNYLSSITIGWKIVKTTYIV